jgi:hypothetical protein
VSTDTAGSTVLIEYDGDADSQGRRRFIAIWSTPEMRASAASCAGACCVGPDGERRDSAIHRPVRAQCFHADPAPSIARWRADGFEVTERNANTAPMARRRTR